MHFPTKKWGVNFFTQKRPNRGEGGSEGGLVKDHTFATFFYSINIIVWCLAGKVFQPRACSKDNRVAVDARARQKTHVKLGFESTL